MRLWLYKLIECDFTKQLEECSQSLSRTTDSLEMSCKMHCSSRHRRREDSHEENTRRVWGLQSNTVLLYPSRYYTHSRSGGLWGMSTVLSAFQKAAMGGELQQRRQVCQLVNGIPLGEKQDFLIPANLVFVNHFTTVQYIAMLYWDGKLPGRNTRSLLLVPDCPHNKEIVSSLSQVYCNSCCRL